jgi:hypothetical protein
MRLSTRLGLCLFGFALVTAGCQKPFDERIVKIEPPGIHSIDYEPFPKDKNVIVTVSAPGTPVSAYLTIDKNRKVTEQRLSSGKDPVPLPHLYGKDKIEDDTFEGLIPAKTPFAVVIRYTGIPDDATKPAYVTLRLSTR